jgi:predicted O-methyltransferase YrrM
VAELDTPVELLQHDGEFAALLALYVERAPLAVLEVGGYAGGSLYHWLQNAVPGALVVSIDDRLDYRERCAEWQPLAVNVVTIQGNSHDPFVVQQAEAFGPYEWTFIDADHHDRAVRADWSNYMPLTTRDGLVVLHDISETDDETIEVAPFWHELESAYRTTEIVRPGGFGFGVVEMPDAAPVAA